MLIAGNWKMNLDRDAAVDVARQIVRAVQPSDVVGVAVCPSFVCLDAVSRVLQGSGIGLGAQNMHAADSGAFTGEVSASMLHSVGCTYVILGHSERRQFFGELDEGVAAKAKQAMAKGLVPIVCVGETLAERDAGAEGAVVTRQVDGALAALSAETGKEFVVAYEPVWAIGTGRTATPEQAQEMHALIRDRLSHHFGGASASRVHVLYGGSMKPENAHDLLRQDDVDGGLIGGASLKAEPFSQIVDAAKAVVG